jgi:hypothetical protein
LREVRDAGRACDPDFSVWAEGCHDRLGQCFDIHQGSYGEGPTTAFSVTVGQTFPEQFRYTWPRAVVVGGAGDVTGLCRTFAQGKPFDCSGDAFADPAFATLHAALLGLRKARPEYFARGVYRHDEGMRVLAPVLATSLQGARGRLVCLRVPGARPEQEFRTVLECAFSYGDVKALHPETCHLAAGARTDVMFTGPLAVVEFLEASLSST